MSGEAPSQKAMSETNRRSANFQPSIWGDHFLTYASEVVKMHLSSLFVPFECQRLHANMHVYMCMNN
jgi:hypothetical protein